MSRKPLRLHHDPAARSAPFSHRWRLVAVAGMVFVAVGVVGLPGPAHAATSVAVTTQADSVSTSASGCKNTGVGVCSLREAVIFANAHAGTVISLPAGNYKLTRIGRNEGVADTGDLDVHVDTTITGAGAGVTIIDGNGASASPDRIFDIYANTGAPINVAISGVTMQHGDAADSYGGGAFWSLNAKVTVTNSVLTDNVTSDLVGGAVVNDGRSFPGTSLTIVGSIVRNNVASGSTVANGGGGGVYAVSDSLTVSNTTISANQVIGGPGGAANSGMPGGGAFGGGLRIDGPSTAVIVGSAIVGNHVTGGPGTSGGGGQEARGGDGFGGGIYSAAQPGWIVNTTITGNVATGGTAAPGTGTFHFAGSGSGGGVSATQVNLVNTTIVANTSTGGLATGGAKTGNGLGGGVYSLGGTITNSIVAKNVATSTSANPGPDVNHIGSGGHNLIGVGDTSATLAPSDISGTPGAPLDPKIASSLADNGGPTQTFELLAGSPAINGGDDAVCANPLPPATAASNGAGNVDERGIARPQPLGGHCDIGALEHVFAPTTTTLTSSVNPAEDGQAFTLTAAVTASTMPTGTVTFADGATSLGVVPLTTGVAAVTTSLSRGHHSITASYSGDSTNAPSSATLDQLVARVGGELQFYPLAKPVRLLDTRPAHPALVSTGAALTPNQSIALPGHFTIDGITVPLSAQALVGNATVDNSAGAPAGFATLFPSGSDLPLASNLNYVAGTVRPNAFTVGLGVDGQFKLLSSSGGDFIIDITGYYAPPGASGLYFHPLQQPFRLLDTRAGANALVRPGAALGAGQVVGLPGQFSVAGVTVPPSAKALAGNATVDNSANAPAGFATLYPGDGALPPTSNLNYAPGVIAPNAFIVGLGQDGTFNLYSQSGGDFIIDITGYFDNVPSGGLVFTPLAVPVRELDTRPGQPASIHPGHVTDAAGTLNLPGAFTYAGVTIPSVATALVGNATVDNTVNAPGGFATLYPGGAPFPLASNLNYSSGTVAPNAFIVGVGANGSYNLFSQSATNFIIDISGYFAPS
ncbi:MAG: polysaccharide deacetylase [Acidimicrobiales bacterium]|nr:polysaccharide deacetylase [Acidimicrobiales bacterium]